MAVFYHYHYGVMFDEFTYLRGVTVPTYTWSEFHISFAPKIAGKSTIRKNINVNCSHRKR